jgi:hypothetical protein
MGYSAYPTDRGLAGYDVPDTCHAPDCDQAIDRGLSYLCGSDPRWPEPGCGGWFCNKHLSYTGDDECQQLCGACWTE